MKPKHRRLLLASASPRRRELLRQLDIPFRTATAEIREYSDKDDHLAPREICLANATAKARTVGRRYPRDLILGADTEVVLGSRVLGKPESRREAARFLASLSGRTHEVITAVCLLCHEAGWRLSFTEATDVTFHTLSPRRIARYLAAVNPLDKAGAYAIQENGEWIIERIEGSLTNVVGLPLAALRRALAQVPPAIWPGGGVARYRASR